MNEAMKIRRKQAQISSIMVGCSSAFVYFVAYVLVVSLAENLPSDGFGITYQIAIRLLKFWLFPIGLSLLVGIGCGFKWWEGAMANQDMKVGGKIDA